MDDVGRSRHYSMLAVLPDKLKKVIPHQRLSLRAFCGCPHAVSQLSPPPQEPRPHLPANTAFYLTRTLHSIHDHPNITNIPVFFSDK